MKVDIGTFPRLLGRYSRDLGLFTLEEAVRRMTSFPAQRMGLEGVGCIAEEQQADLVLLNPETIDDRTASERADAPPAGIAAVLLDGQVVARGGRVVCQERRGRVLLKS